jgi:hypothetical protein
MTNKQNHKTNEDTAEKDLINRHLRSLMTSSTFMDMGFIDSSHTHDHGCEADCGHDHHNHTHSNNETESSE